MKIGISGIGGFVGSNLRQRLNKDFEILGISRKSDKNKGIYAFSEISTVLNQSEVFIHLAGKAHDLKNTSEPEDYFRINTRLTETLFDEFLSSSCSIFIHFSSVKAVADKVEGVLTESLTPNPKTAYGKSKLEAEQYILSKKIPDGKKFYILRPCLIHGKNNKGNLKLLHSFVKKGLPYPLGAFSNQRSYLSIDNLEFFLRQLLSQRIKSGIYNISDDTPVSTKQLIQIISSSLGKKTMIWNVPKVGIEFLAKIGSLLGLPFNTEKVEKLTENYVVSNSKIKTALNIDMPHSCISGLETTFSSMRED